MRDFKRLIVINDGDYNGWTSSTRTAFLITVEGNYLKVSGYSGRDMFPYEINHASASAVAFPVGSMIFSIFASFQGS